MGQESSVAVSCGVGCRCGSNLALLWHRPEAVALIRSLACELPYAMNAALKKKKEKGQEKEKRKKMIKKNYISNLFSDSTSLNTIANCFMESSLKNILLTVYHIVVSLDFVRTCHMSMEVSLCTVFQK